MIVVGSRVVIRQSVRADILQDLVLMLPGTTKTGQRVRLSVYWPNLDNDIFNITKRSEECNKNPPS